MRGLGIACRPSVRPSARSVTLVDCDHIGWKSWKLIARTISPTPSLFVAKRRSTKNFGETRGGVGKKWYAGEQKLAIYLKRVKIEEKLLWTTYIRNSSSLFRTVPSLTLYGLPFLEIGGLQLSYPLLSQEEVKLRTSNLTGTFTGQLRIKAH